MSTSVLEVRPGAGLAAYAPKSVKQMGVTTTGIYINDAARGTIPWSRLRMMTAVSLVKNDRKQLVLLVVLEGRKNPLLISARRLAYGSFPGLDDAPSRTNFRRVVSILCRQCKNISIDVGTYTFLKSGKLLSLAEPDLLGFSTALVRAVAPKGEDLEVTIGGADDDRTLPHDIAFDDRSRTQVLPQAAPAAVAPPKSAPPITTQSPPAPLVDSLDATAPAVTSPESGFPGAATADDFGAAFPEFEAPATPVPQAPPTNPFAAAFPELRDPEPGNDLDAFPELEDVASTLISCPKCGFEQEERQECENCGVLIDKYRKMMLKRQEELEIAAAAAGQDLATQVGAVEPAEQRQAAAPLGGPVFASAAQDEGEISDRFLSMDAALRMTLGLLRDNVAPMLGITLIFTLMTMGLVAVFSLMSMRTPIFASLCVLVVGLSSYSVLSLALTYYLDQMVEQGRCDIGEALSTAFTRAPRAVLARLLSFLLVILGMFAFVVPGVVYGLRFYFVEVVCAVENPDFLEIGATSVSQNLVRGYEFSLFAFLAGLTALAFGVIYIPLLGMVVFAGASLLSKAASLSILIQILFALFYLGFSLVSTIFVITFNYVVYLELRTLNQERMNRVVLVMEPMTRAVLVIDAVLLAWFLVNSLM